MKSPGKILAEFRREAEDDWIGLWAIAWMVRHDHAKANASEVRKLTMRLVRMMMESGLVVGGFCDKSFVPWPDQGTASVIRRIEREWNALGRDPTLGEVAWFGTPIRT